MGVEKLARQEPTISSYQRSATRVFDCIMLVWVYMGMCGIQVKTLYALAGKSESKACAKRASAQSRQRACVLNLAHCIGDLLYIEIGIVTLYSITRLVGLRDRRDNSLRPDDSSTMQPAPRTNGDVPNFNSALSQAVVYARAHCSSLGGV